MSTASYYSRNTTRYRHKWSGQQVRVEPLTDNDQRLHPTLGGTPHHDFLVCYGYHGIDDLQVVSPERLERDFEPA